MAAAPYHNVVLLSNGTVRTWGDNSSGQATVPAGLSSVTAIAASWSHSAAVSMTPGIFVQPQSLLVSATSNATLSVSAGGGEPLAYQWRKDGLDLAGATTATLSLANVQTNQGGYYTVVITNAWGSITSSVAGLAVNLLIQTISFGGLPGKRLEDAPFAVAATASSGLAVGFSVVSGPATMSGTTITLTGAAGMVVVRAAQFGNTNYQAASSVEQSFTVVASPPPFAVRQLPAGYAPGSRFTVTITAGPAANVGVYAVEDGPPAGWTVGSINNSGSFDAPNGKVKFGPFFDATVRTLTYEVTPPTNATGILTFVGTASGDGFNSAIGGGSLINPAPRHPADKDAADNRLTIGEVTAYGAAWKAGATWPLAPNPIPISYVTRAGALWKNGETYRFDPAVASAPLWWVNTGLAPAGLRPLGGMATAIIPAAVTPGEAMADLAGGGFQRNRDFVLTLRVRPTAGVQAYAVEETVPVGWNVKPGSLDQGGAYDGNSRKVKWGPFFDTVERELICVLEPGANTAPVVFAGVASFDGVDVPFRGRRAIQRGAFLPENVNVGRDVKRDGYRVVVIGEAGKRYDIEATGTPGVPSSWVAVATNLDGTALVDFTDTLAATRQARFYRVIER